MSMRQEDHLRAEDQGRIAGHAVEKSATEVSQGLKTGRIRWVLLASLLPVVIALGSAWLNFSHSRPRPAPAVAARQSGAG